MARVSDGGMLVVNLTGRPLELFLQHMRELVAVDRWAIKGLRAGIDEEGLKFSVNGGTWSRPFPDGPLVSGMMHNRIQDEEFGSHDD